MTTGKKIAVITGLLAAMLLVIEVVLRLSLGLGSPPLVQADDEIGYLFQADQDLQRFGNRIYINSYHQRSDGLLDEEDAVRVLFVGDSVTWVSVLLDQDETYPELFKQASQTTCERPVEALNASAGSWGIGNQRAYLEHFGTFDSQFVILQIGSHDLLQATSTAEVVGSHPGFPDEAPLLATEELLTRYAWPRVRNVLGMIALPMEAHARLQDDSSHAKFDRNMRDLAVLIDMIRAGDGKPVVLYTPDRNEVVRENTTFADTYEPYRPAFFALTDSLNVPVIDMLAKWQGATDTPRYFRDGVHLSAEGNQAVATVLNERLATLSLAAACQR